MNAAGHIAVAAALIEGPGESSEGRGRGAPGPLALLGAALPDLAAMGGFRLLGAEAGGRGGCRPLAAGIHLHHRTDEAFHRHPWFTERNRALYDQLRASGFERGPARACGHVGTELLLDGQLLHQEAVAGATDAALDAIGPNEAALRPLARTTDPRAWLTHLDRVVTHRLPDDYHQPAAVAPRLHRILRRRPRLAFDPTLIGPLSDALAHHQPAVEATAATLVDELVAELASDPRTEIPSTGW